MPDRQVPFNFSAGPAILHPTIFERAAAAVRELAADGHAPQAPGTGLSILEVSHRDADYTQINAQAIALCHSVLGIPDTHEVMFMQGGATLQFGMIPLNFLPADKTAYFVDTGVWASKAYNDAKQVGRAEILASSETTGYDRIPVLPAIVDRERVAYVHTTSNNTIYGTEYPEIPDFGEVAHVVDCSSNIGSRPLQFERVAIGYAGAQKNLGPSGVTVVFIRKDLLPKAAKRGLPGYLDFFNHAKEPGLYNTPNTFGVLVLKLVLEWMRDLGGLPVLAALNGRKAGKLYDFIDQSQLYAARAQAGHRSQMNVCFTLRGDTPAASEALTKAFLQATQRENMNGLRGHRLAGGCRASIYNAFPEAGVDALIEVMREFERTHG